MGWETEAVTTLRVMIGDMTDPPKYSDARLTQLYLVGAKLTAQQVDFSTAYTINLSGTITPDPTASGTYDTDFFNLSILKSLCILMTGEARIAAGKSFSMMDRGASVDMRNLFPGASKMAQNACQEFMDQRFLYLVEKRTRGLSVTGPFGSIVPNNPHYLE